MADQKVSDLPSLSGSAVDPADLLYIVDSSAGTAGSKKITIGQFQLAPYSAGTINGITYFDGSKVLSSGSGLTFDGTNLGVGTSSPAQIVDISKAQNAATILAIRNSNAGAIASVGLVGNADTAVGRFNVYSSGAAGGLANCVSIEQSTANPILFYVNSSEAMRVTGARDLLLGATSNSNNYKFHIRQDGDSASIGIFANSATTPYGINVYYSATAPNNSNANTSFLYCNDTVGLKLQLNSNGGVQNFQANDTNISDRREKTNFAPAKDYLDTICAIPVQTFNYIDQNLEQDPGLTLGVVAQDVQAVAPELVHESDWGTQDEPKMRLSIYQTDLQYALMKCIQELKAELDATKARLAALESK